MRVSDRLTISSDLSLDNHVVNVYATYEYFRIGCVTSGVSDVLITIVVVINVY